MDQLIGARATTGVPGGPRDARGQRREFSAEELDAVADAWWRWTGAKGRLAACATAMLSRLPRNRGRRGASASARTGARGRAHAPSH